MKNLKRLKALAIAGALVLCVAGCSQKEADSASSSSSSESSAAESSLKAAPAESDNSNAGASNVKYTLYDDLSNYVRILFHEIYISVPTWREDEVIYGYNFSNSLDYVMCVTYNVDDEYTGAIEDILDDTYDEFTSAIDYHAFADVFFEYKLDTKEKVTLDCGAEAMKFEGYISADEYTRIVDYYIYGYSFVYDGATITIGAAIDNPEAIDANKDFLKDIIDRSVKTIRTEL